MGLAVVNLAGGFALIRWGGGGWRESGAVRSCCDATLRCDRPTHPLGVLLKLGLVAGKNSAKRFATHGFGDESKALCALVTEAIKCCERVVAGGGRLRLRVVEIGREGKDAEGDGNQRSCLEGRPILVADAERTVGRCPFCEALGPGGIALGNRAFRRKGSKTRERNEPRA